MGQPRLTTRDWIERARVARRYIVEHTATPETIEGQKPTTPEGIMTRNFLQNIISRNLSPEQVLSTPDDSKNWELWNQLPLKAPGQSMLRVTNYGRLAKRIRELAGYDAVTGAITTPHANGTATVAMGSKQPALPAAETTTPSETTQITNKTGQVTGAAQVREMISFAMDEYPEQTIEAVMEVIPASVIASALVTYLTNAMAMVQESEGTIAQLRGEVEAANTLLEETENQLRQQAISITDKDERIRHLEGELLDARVAASSSAARGLPNIPFFRNKVEGPK